MPGWTDLLREGDGRGAAAATDIDDPLARLGPGAIDQSVSDGPEQDVLRLLPIGPALASGSVPVCNLVGVLLVACRGGHVWKLSEGPPSLFELRRDSLRAAGLPRRSPGGGEAGRRV